MSAEEKWERNVQLIIKIILYLLLAIAFIAEYEIAIEGQYVIINPLIIRLFILGGLAILCLFFAYIINKKDLLWIGYISTIPFILIFFYLFTKLLYYSVSGEVNMGGGLNFLSDLIKLVWILSISPSTLAILVFLDIILGSILIYELVKK